MNDSVERCEMKLSETQVAQFEEEGVLVVEDLDGRLPEERPIELKAGSCSFHHGLILHSSRPNRSNLRRRGYATHYVSARCRFTGPAENNDAMPVRGESIPGCI